MNAITVLTNPIARLGSLIVFSRRRKCVRQGVVFFLTNALLIAGSVFAIEVVLIVLGVNNIYLPLNRQALGVLSKLFL